MSFLISFMVDARGGAMRGRRHSGVRIIIPPRKASMPTRVTCRLIKKEKLMHPLPINEGEALAARILEMGPVATKFLGRIVIEIPHFASLRGKEREIKILRSDNGEKWEEHPILATDDAVNKALNESLEDLEHEDDLANKRITRILTDDFPRYFALVTRVREERQSVGEEGGVISSTVVPQVQAVFPEGALTKKIRVGLQAQPISPDLVAKLLGNRVAVSPIVTVEPRRRKFHKTITLTIPVPKAQQKGMINPHRDDLPTLRVLYSISEGTDSAIWDDLTDQTQLKLVNDCVSFTTRVSGRFWLMDCQNYSDATRMATELYREAVVVPYMARFVVFAKRTGEQEGKLRMFCMTDDKIDKTLEKQEHFVEVARSRDVEVLEGRQQFVEMAGNLIPITKSGDQLYVDFKAFRENRLPCTVRIRDLDQEPAARVAFMKEPKVARGEVPQTPICNLNISLPDMSTSSSMEMDGDAALELRKRSSLLKEYGIVIEDTVSRAKIKLNDVADSLKGDWVFLAQQLDFTSGEINQIKNDYNTVNDQALAMLQLWVAKDKEQATGNALEKALTRINREDVVKKCMYNVETVEDEVEAAAARVAMDQSGFDTFTEEVGISRDSSMKRGMSLDVQYDEQDIIKESESVAEESGSDVGSVEERSAPQAREEDTEQGDDDQIVMEVDSRRGVAKEEVKHESNQEDFIDLISQLDKYAEVKDRKQTKQQDTDDRQSIQEDELTQNRHDRDVAAYELFSKLEEVGQQSAPQQMATQSQEQVAPDSEAIEALAQSLSFGEPPRDEASQPEETVFDSDIPPEETRYEETLPDGTVVKHKKIRKFSRQPTLDAEDEVKCTEELTESEGPIKEEIDVQESEEILPDGTIHSFQKVRRHSVKHIRKILKSETGDEDIFEGDVTIPGTNREDIIETFEEPARQVRDVEDIEDTLPDGTKVKKQIISSRMVHRILTHHESVDEGGEKQEERYEIDEIIPGTESCFIECDESSSSSSDSYTDEDDELGAEIHADLGEVEEVLGDGSVIRKRKIESHETIRVKSQSGDIDEAETSKTITEERYIPSPRSMSPVTVEDNRDFPDMAKEVVQRTIRSAHFDAVQKGDEIETSFDKTEDEMVAPSGHMLTEAAEAARSVEVDVEVHVESTEKRRSVAEIIQKFEPVSQGSKGEQFTEEDMASRGEISSVFTEEEVSTKYAEGEVSTKYAEEESVMTQSLEEVVSMETVAKERVSTKTFESSKERTSSASTFVETVVEPEFKTVQESGEILHRPYEPYEALEKKQPIADGTSSSEEEDVPPPIVRSIKPVANIVQKMETKIEKIRQEVRRDSLSDNGSGTETKPSDEDFSYEQKEWVSESFTHQETGPNVAAAAEGEEEEDDDDDWEVVDKDEIEEEYDEEAVPFRLPSPHEQDVSLTEESLEEPHFQKITKTEERVVERTTREDFRSHTEKSDELKYEESHEKSTESKNVKFEQKSYQDFSLTKFENVEEKSAESVYSKTEQNRHITHVEI